MADFSLTERQLEELQESDRILRLIARKTNPYITYSKEILEKTYEFFQNGEGLMTLVAYLGVKKDIVRKWREQYPEFNDAVEIGLARSAAINEEIGRQGAIGIRPNMNAAIYNMIMTNNFGWKNKTDITSNDEKIESGNTIIKIPMDVNVEDLFEEIP